MLQSLASVKGKKTTTFSMFLKRQHLYQHLINDVDRTRNIDDYMIFTDPSLFLFLSMSDDITERFVVQVSFCINVG